MFSGRVCVIGLGYIGLPTSVVLASRGLEVVGVDVKPDVVDTINRGEVHIVEPDLEAVTRVAVQKGHLRATLKPERADVFIIAVPTPFREQKPDVSYVEAAADAVAPHLSKGNVVIVESTSPVGTTEAISRRLAEARGDLRFPTDNGGEADVHVAYCPERVLPGNVLNELVSNDRIIGGITAESAEKAAAVYNVFCRGTCHLTNARVAELCKLTENAFRDVNIAFANELSLICERLGVNVWDLIRLANCHPRVSILRPGPGVGGHCIAVDPWFIVASAPEEARIIRTAREINDSKPAVVTAKIRDGVEAAFLNGKARPAVACLGLTFKADIDDIRESPALAITECVAAWGDCDVLVAEPYLDILPRSLLGENHVHLTEVEKAVDAADVIALLVNHRLFSNLDRSRLVGKSVIDTRGMWS